MPPLTACVTCQFLQKKSWSQWSCQWKQSVTRSSQTARCLSSPSSSSSSCWSFFCSIDLLGKLHLGRLPIFCFFITAPGLLLFWKAVCVCIYGCCPFFRLSSGSSKMEAFFFLRGTCHATCAVAAARSRRASSVLPSSAPRTAASQHPQHPSTQSILAAKRWRDGRKMLPFTWWVQTHHYLWLCGIFSSRWTLNREWWMDGWTIKKRPTANYGCNIVQAHAGDI